MKSLVNALVGFIGPVLALIGFVALVGLVYLWAQNQAIEVERRGNMTLCEREVDDLKRAGRYTTRDCKREQRENWEKMTPEEKARLKQMILDSAEK